MRFSTITCFLAATLTSAGNVYVDNKCSFSIYLVSFANRDTPAFQTELFAGSTPGYIEIERAATRPAGNNTIIISRNPSLASSLIFSYSQNAEVNTVFYSFVSNRFDEFEHVGYEVLTDGGRDAVVCTPRTRPSVCPNARDSIFRPAEPVYTVPLNSQPTGPNFTVRLCQSDGRS